METLSSKPNLIIEDVFKSEVSRASKRIPKQLQWRFLKLGLVINDILMIGLAFRVAYFIRFELKLQVFQLDAAASINYYQQLTLLLIPSLIIIYLAAGLYTRQKLLGGTEEYETVFNATTVGMFIVFAVVFWEPDFILARGWLVLAWFFAFLFTSMGRFSLRRLVYTLRKRGLFLSNALIIGANEEGLSLANQLMSWKTSGLQVLGFIDKKLPAGTEIFHNLRVLGGVDQVDRLVEDYDIEELILASSAITSRDKMMEIFQCFGTSSDVNVRMSSGLYEIITTGLTVKEFAYVPLVGINRVRLSGLDRALKLLLDYLLTIPGLIALSPILLVIGLAVKLDSPGPSVHRRRVMGVNGEQFDAYKFRTMYTNGDDLLASHPELQAELMENHKLKQDPRITRLGGFLRKTSLDELPQLFNVLKREMSLVGPRIIAPEEVEKYSKWDMNLLTVQPGITGLWQVSGRSDVSYEERVRLDMFYIRNWSIWLDLQILFRTIPAVIRGKGAY
jgi:exopolysaccharide biosynthesis polyprenyl glycosylphosphotransferase